MSDIRHNNIFMILSFNQTSHNDLRFDYYLQTRTLQFENNLQKHYYNSHNKKTL